MTDVTDLVQRYRLTLRHIWNTCFWSDPNLRHWESVHSFRALKLPLFRSLIAEPLDLEAGDVIFGAGFVVVSEMSGDGLPRVHVNIREPSRPDEGTWMPLDGPFRDVDVGLTLVDLFDWTPLAWSDLRYYVVLIERFLSHPDKVGHHALVDTTCARVLYNSGESVAQVIS